MIIRFKQMVSEKLKLSGIRGCMAAGAVTAGIAALAVIGGINNDISTVSLETDVIPEETAVTAEAEAEKSAKKTYSHDMEYFSEEDIERIAAEAEKTGRAVSEAAVSEETAGEEDDSEAYEENAEEEVSYDESVSSAETESYEETAPYEEDKISEKDEVYEDNSTSDEEASENGGEAGKQDTVYEAEEEGIDSVAVRSSAADGDDDAIGLSSALDLDVSGDSEQEPVAAVFAEEEDSAAAMFVYGEADEAAGDESDIPEDITLDDEGTEDTAPEEDAVSLLDVPEWLSFDENGVPTEYVNVLTGNACAYTADPDSLMSTGKSVFQGYVAVDPDIIPYGSELYIVAEDGEVYGYAIAADTGYSVRMGHIIVDLFMNEYDDCIQWGNKPVNVYVLK